MRAGLALLVVAYVLSQFYRAFLAVLSPVLQTDLGASAADLSRASGLWFLVFAAMQFPVGAALDKFGPRRTAGWLLAVFGGTGAALFAAATTSFHLTLAMGLIGAGCSPVLMAAYTIFARSFPPQSFATLAASMVGLGSLGNILGSAPLAAAVEVWGWRGTMGGLAMASVLVGLALLAFLRDPPPATDAGRGSVLDVLRMRALWPIFAMMFVCYAPAAALRSLWIGPWAIDGFGADKALIGQISLVMGLAMVAGNFAYGPVDRWLGRRKALVLAGNLAVALACLALWALPLPGLWVGAALFALIGLAGASFGIVVAHGRAFVPAHLTGRGVTMLNLFGILGVAVGQFASAPLSQGGLGGVFLYFGITTLVGCLLYLRAQDRNA